MRNLKHKLLIILFNLIAISAFAAVPRYINFQGKLAGAGGKAVSGTINMKFKLYTYEIGSLAVWS